MATQLLDSWSQMELESVPPAARAPRHAALPSTSPIQHMRHWERVRQPHLDDNYHEARSGRPQATHSQHAASPRRVATANQHAPPGHTDRPPVPNNRHVPQPQRKILAKPDLHRPPLCSVRPAALNSQHTSQSQKKLARGVSKKPRGMASDGTNQPPVDQASQPPDHRLPAKKADKAKRLWHAQALRDVLSPASLRHYTTVTSVAPGWPSPILDVVIHLHYMIPNMTVPVVVAQHFLPAKMLLPMSLRNLGSQSQQSSPLWQLFRFLQMHVTSR